MKQRQTSNAHEAVWNFNFCHLTLILPVWSQRIESSREADQKKMKEGKEERIYVYI